MKYLICQEWENTKGNHTGMAYLCTLIKNSDDEQYKVINVPDILFYTKVKKIFSLQAIIQPYIYNVIYFFITLFLLVKIKKGDTVFLFEYLLKERNQLIVAKLLKMVKGNNINIYGIAHLTPVKLTKMFSDRELDRYSSCLDFYLTFGSSLTSYLQLRGINSEKIITTFHYVDNNYYAPCKHDAVAHNLTVIVMGMQMRDFSFIADIVKNLPSVQFIICNGFINLEKHFTDCTNVILKGFIPEDELKNEMNNADISLNMMIDTVGSNVITTSMAMGLVMLVSDVGSIRDYCKTSNSFFCTESKEFIDAINLLNADNKLLTQMKASSLELSKQTRFDNFYNFLQNLN